MYKIYRSIDLSVDYYDLASVSHPVVASYNITHSAATFAIDIQPASVL